MLPKSLKYKLEQRQKGNAFRALTTTANGVDFSSNDYLGLAKNVTSFNNAIRFLKQQQLELNGATGSRLLTGNSNLFNMLETKIARFHKTETALLFNSGYTANLGLLSSIPQRHDAVFYDELSHASIRDGLQLCNAKCFKFKHNNLQDLETKLQHLKDEKSTVSTIYIVTESVFSMDGDSPDLKALIKLCKTYNAHIILDEAHAVGVLGNNGEGLVQLLGLENHIFARLVTFGKALGTHGAAWLITHDVKAYLINFSRAFIYTTALPPHTLATIFEAYNLLDVSEVVTEVLEVNHKNSPIKKLHNNINYFKQEVKKHKLNSHFIESHSAIQSCIVKGNTKVKAISKKLKKHGFDVRPIVSPTVPKNKERLRFCLHSYNTKKEIVAVLELLAKFLYE